VKLRVEDFPAPLRTLLRWLRIDFRSIGSPSASGLLLATVVALVGSLLADYLLVKLGTAVFPSTKGFVHFRFSDYSKLTIIGVIIACVAWPIVTQVTSSPRWLFLRAAIVVTIVLFAPDAWIWHEGSSATAVFVLIWLHIAIAIVTYSALVHLAPVRRAFKGRHARG
jgi:hypothetical protein